MVNKDISVHLLQYISQKVWYFKLHMLYLQIKDHFKINVIQNDINVTHFEKEFKHFKNVLMT